MRQSAETRSGRWFERLASQRGIGPVLFLAVMWLAFTVTTDVAAPFVDWIDAVVSGPVRRWILALTDLAAVEGTWIESLIADGVLGGVGAVLAFVPVLLALYTSLAVLEQSGYLARGSHAIDGAMRLLGLPGRAFLPMMLGFGCTVPAVLALRSLPRPRDRVLAGMMVPFMSCGARLPVYVLLATAFFVDHRTIAVFSMYMIGLVVAGLLGVILGRTVLRGPASAAMPATPPPLRLPSPGGVWSLVRRRTGEFLRDAGSVILMASLVVWLLLAVPIRSGSFADVEVGDSAFATVSRVAAPALEPLGFGDWRQAGALGGGLVAKEVVVSTLAQVYGVAGDDGTTSATNMPDDLAEIADGFVTAVGGAARALPGIIGLDLGDDTTEQPATLVAAIRVGFDESSGGHGPAAGLAFMVFVLLYTPCAATLATLRRELGGRWMAVAAVGQLAVAWVGGFIAYRVALLAGMG